MPAVVALEVADVGLAAGNLAAGHARPGTVCTVPLLPGEALLLELLVDLGAGAGDAASEEVGADEAGVSLADPAHGLNRLREKVRVGISGRSGRGDAVGHGGIPGIGEEVVVGGEVKEVGEVPGGGGGVVDDDGRVAVHRLRGVVEGRRMRRRRRRRKRGFSRLHRNREQKVQMEAERFT